MHIIIAQRGGLQTHQMCAPLLAPCGSSVRLNSEVIEVLEMESRQTRQLTVRAAAAAAAAARWQGNSRSSIA